MDKPEEIIYVPWPLETIKQAWEEFRDTMYNGAGVEELLAGLHGMDFLMRASDIPDDMLEMIHATLDNAHIRVRLMVEEEAARMSEVEMRANALRVITLLDAQIRSIKQLGRYRNLDADDLRERLQAYMEYKRNA